MQRYELLLTVQSVWGPVGHLVIEDVGVKDKAPSEILGRSPIIPS